MINYIHKPGFRILIILAALVVFGFFGRVIYLDIDFEKNHNTTKGVVIDFNTPNSDGGQRYDYNYNIKGATYKGTTSQDDKYPVKVGDTVIVKYYIKDFSKSGVDSRPEEA